jgi:hypothetical protein
MKKLPSNCPACGGRLTVRRMACAECDTAIDGDFQLPPLARLSAEDQEFVMQFVRASGSLKEMAQILHLSYPTVRNRLNDIIERCAALEVDRTNE